MPNRPTPTRQQIIERAQIRAAQVTPYFQFFTGALAGAGANFFVTNYMNLNPRQTHSAEEVSYDINRQLLPLALAAMLIVMSSRSRNPIHIGMGIGLGFMAMYQVVTNTFNHLNRDHLNATNDITRVARRP